MSALNAQTVSLNDILLNCGFVDWRKEELEESEKAILAESDSD